MSTSEVPPVPEPAVQRGAWLLADGRAPEAVDVLKGVVAEAPIYAAAHVLLAAALDAAGRPEEALDVWHRAAFLVPSSPLVQRERRRLSGAPEPAAPTAPGPTAPSPADAIADVPREPRSESAPEETPESHGAPAPSNAAPASAPASAPDSESARDAAPALETDAAGGAQPAPSADDAPAPAPHELPAPNELPEGAHVAPAEELFTRAPREADGAPEPAPENEGGPSPAAPPPQPLPVPDWGDLSDPALAILPPEEPAPPPEVPDDPGGWAILAEAPRPERPRGPLQPDIVPPDEWTPPPEATPRTVPGAPTVPPPEATSPPTWAPPATPPPAPLAPAAPVPDDMASGDAPGADAAPAPGDEPALADDLDALIESLETAPRITPDPNFEAPLPDLDRPVDDLASETLAKIYAAQHQYVEAAVVYERLAARAPEQAEALLARAAEMRRHAS